MVCYKITQFEIELFKFDLLSEGCWLFNEAQAVLPQSFPMNTISFPCLRVHRA